MNELRLVAHYLLTVSTSKEVLFAPSFRNHTEKDVAPIRGAISDQAISGDNTHGWNIKGVSNKYVVHVINTSPIQNVSIKKMPSTEGHDWLARHKGSISEHYKKGVSEGKIPPASFTASSKNS